MKAERSVQQQYVRMARLYLFMFPFTERGACLAITGLILYMSNVRSTITTLLPRPEDTNQYYLTLVCTANPGTRVRAGNIKQVLLYDTVVVGLPRDWAQQRYHTY